MRLLVLAAAVSVWFYITTASANEPITDETACRDILRAPDVQAEQMSIALYAAAQFDHYGLPIPKDLAAFGMNIAMECMARMPPDTSVLVVANKVLSYWHD